MDGYNEFNKRLQQHFEREFRHIPFIGKDGSKSVPHDAVLSQYVQSGTPIHTISKFKGESFKC
jgi:hypothetical protein